MSVNEDIRKAIQNLADKNDEVYSIVCKVSDVNVITKLCSCTPIDGGAVITNVRLMADNKTGILITPKNNSIVIVTMINKYTGYVSMFSEVDEIQLNGDINGGLIKVTELTTKLNLLVTELQAQLTLIAAGIAAGGGTYTPATLSTFDKTIYEKITVKHGNG